MTLLTPYSFSPAASAVTQINLDTTGASQNVTYGTNTLTVNQSGIFSIFFQTALTSIVDSAITVGVRVNGTTLVPLSQTLTSGDNTYVGYGTAVLAAGDVLDIAATTPSATTITIDSGGVRLVVTKLSD